MEASPQPDGHANGGVRCSHTASRHLASMPLPQEPAPDADDEYGEMRADGHTHIFDAHRLENGSALQQVPVNYKTWGTLNPERDNALVVCHALTGNASLDSWWGDLLGPGRPFDTSRYFIVCANILGSCYGTCGPASVNPATQRPYGSAFPAVTVRDTVRLHARLLREALGVQSVACVVGGSLGGMQTLEWACCEPAMVRAVVAMACGADHAPWQIAYGESQRQAIYADTNWRGTPTAACGALGRGSLQRRLG
jgi:homoserine O-acetyltransferase